MEDIEQALNEIFKFPRVGRPILYHMNQRAAAASPNEFINVQVRSEKYGFKGLVPFMGQTDYKGGVDLAVYVPEPDLYMNGERLAGELSKYNDCPFVMYGVLGQCLALMVHETHKIRISRIMLVNLNDCSARPITIKQNIAEDFMYNLNKKEIQKKNISNIGNKGRIINQQSMF